MTSSPHEVARAAARTKVGRVWAGVRLAIAIVIVGAVGATVMEAAGRTTVNPFNLFGYFTIQANLLLAAVLALLGALGSTGRQPPAWMEAALAACVTYIVLVGLVYAVLLAPLGAAGGVPVRWANVVLHVVTPLYAVADWVMTPRRALPVRTVLFILIYPVLWLAVVLVRGPRTGGFRTRFWTQRKGTARSQSPSWGSRSSCWLLAGSSSCRPRVSTGTRRRPSPNRGCCVQAAQPDQATWTLSSPMTYSIAMSPPTAWR